MYRGLPIFLLVIPALVHGASFDCRKATTSVERMVCADPDLSKLDDALSETFTLELDREAAATRLRSSQKTWLAMRDSCTNVPCVRQRYEQRIAELSCDPQSRMAGSAIGSNQCSYYLLRTLESELVVLEDQYGNEVSAQSNNPEYTKRTFQAERKAWREYRTAQCALYGATEGGSDGWKNAFSGMCEVDETKKRIAHLKKETRGR